MPVYRIKKTKDYTIIANYHLKEKEMSLKAKGLLTLFLSLPNDWDFSSNGITVIVKESRNTVNEIMRELETFKYLKRTAIRNEKGTITDWQYDIYENPYTNYQDMEKQDIEKQDIDNCIQLNTNKLNTNKLNTKLISNKEIYKEKMFEEFYNTYPKKRNKSKTEEWFTKKKPSEELFKKIMLSLEQHKKTKQWKDEQFIPYPTTWLNQKRWEDDVKNEKEWWEMK